MSREIKFRAWDEEKKFMLNPCDQEIANVYGLDVGASISNSIMRVGTFRKTLMQFTGLTDVEGDNIYEGDILHQLDPISWCPQPVCFHDNSASYKVGMEQLTSSTIKSCELIIVGNIHQNPELLG